MFCLTSGPPLWESRRVVWRRQDFPSASCLHAPSQHLNHLFTTHTLVAGRFKGQHTRLKLKSFSKHSSSRNASFCHKADSTAQQQLRCPRAMVLEDIAF